MSKIEVQFNQFHEKFPQVYATLVRLALEAKVKGRPKIGIGMLWEIVRWEIMLENGAAIESQGYKLNNNFRSRYARLMMEREPELDRMFEVRKLLS